MDYIFRDNEYKNNQNISCRLYEFEDLRRDFETGVFIFVVVVNEYMGDFLKSKYSNVEFLFAKDQGKAIRKAIEKFDLFCGQWFDTGDSDGQVT